MKKLALIGIVGLSVGANAQTVFYGGDLNKVDGLASQVSTAGGFTDARVYDDFSISSAQTITGVFGNFLDATNGGVSSILWEIRSGVSSGNGGVVVASGTNNSTPVATGNSAFGLSEYHYESAVSAFNLNAGTYWLMVALNGGSNAAYVSTTSGSGGVGGPLNNGNSFFDSTQFSSNFKPTGTVLNSGVDGDFSIGLRGSSAVPEPASLAVLGFGALALLRRRKTRA
jgi:hypothetical protein